MHIRPLEEGDLAATANLFCRIFRAKGHANPAAVAAELRRVYLQNPWVERDDPSFVCEAEGRIIGFVGVIPFPMKHEGRPIRAAIGGNYMVDPAFANPMAGARMIKRFVDFPRDLSMTDTSNEMGRTMWEAQGGFTLQLESLQWIRVLRPFGFAGAVASRLRALRPLMWMGGRFLKLADAAISRPARSPFRPVTSELEARELTSADLIEGLTKVLRGQELLPDYSHESLDWLISMAGRKREFGGRLVRKALFLRGAFVGWYLYYPNPGRWGQVVQVAARPQMVRSVMEHLFADAWHAGSTALIGRCHPILMNDLPGLHALCMNRRTWVQVHSRDDAILDSVRRGKALLTRLEGEWWTRFQNDAFDEAEPEAMSSAQILAPVAT